MLREYWIPAGSLVFALFAWAATALYVNSETTAYHVTDVRALTTHYGVYRAPATRFVAIRGPLGSSMVVVDQVGVGCCVSYPAEVRAGEWSLIPIRAGSPCFEVRPNISTLDVYVSGCVDALPNAKAVDLGLTSTTGKRRAVRR